MRRTGAVVAVLARLATKLSLVAVAAFLALALERFARRTIVVLARFRRLARRGNARRLGRHGGACCRGGRIGTRLAKFLVAIAPAAAMPLAFCALAGLAFRHRLRSLLRARLGAMAVALMTRPPILGATAGPPHLDQRR